MRLRSTGLGKTELEAERLQESGVSSLKTKEFVVCLQSIAV